jgi:arylsulfatase A-like enzyme
MRIFIKSLELNWIVISVVVGFLALGISCSVPTDTEKPNVLFIIADDLNDNIGGWGEELQAITPNLDWLRQESVSFTNAFANVALCNPTRASLWSGLYPHTTGFYGYNQHEQEWNNNPILKDAVPLFSHFQTNGYELYGTGKIYHRIRESYMVFDRDSYGVEPSFGPFPYDGKKTVAHPSLKKPYRDDFALRNFGPLSDVPKIEASSAEGIPGYTGWWDQGKPFRYVNENDRDQMVDERSAAWAIEVLNQEHPDPFFLTVGIMRPHRPQVVPQKYFDMYPLEDINIPPYLESDLSDVPEIFWKDIKDLERNKGFSDFRDLSDAYPNNEGWKLWLQSYLACVSYVDDQVGKILDALNNSPYKDNTIIVFTSDHGYHMGEKNYMFKLSVWDESTRIPMIICVPGITDRAGEVNHPVSLIDLYPTLVDLAGLPEQPNQINDGPELDGHSLTPFLDNPDMADWEGPSVALSVLYGSAEPEDQLEKDEPGKVERQHFTVRSEQFRYTLANNGQEELYDHVKDPHEWVNQATNPDYEVVKAELKNELLLITRQK